MAADISSASWKFSCILLVICSVLAKDPQSLFSPKDDIVLLDNKNINQTLHGADTFVLVNFYSSWCGHCHKFAPIFKRLAQDIKDWSPVIQLAAINCADETNHKACVRYNVHGYPTLKCFWPHTPLSFLGDEYGGSHSGDKATTLLRQHMLKYIEKQQLEGKYPHLKKLQPLQSLEHIWHHVGPDVEHTVIVFEESSSFVGQEVILDLWTRKEIVIRRMLKENVTQFGITKFPSVYLIEKGASFQNLASNGTDREHFVTAIRKLLGINEAPSQPEKEFHQLIPRNLEPEVRIDLGKGDQLAQRLKPGVYLEDLITAVRYSLYEEIFALSPTINSTKLQAIKGFVRVLAKYLPCDTSTMVYLQRLNKWLHNFSGDSISVPVWIQMLNKFKDTDAHIPSNTSFVGCRGSDKRYRGFPCSMWVLFHTLTVNAVLDHGMEESFDPKEVLLAMRGFITEIFTCKMCGQNFAKEAKSIEERVLTPQDSILFLWEVHNNVNKRLHGDVTEDPFFPKIQFPSRKLCGDCYSDKSVGDDEKPNFDRKSVLTFLSDFYSRQQIIGTNMLKGVLPPPPLPAIIKNSNTDQKPDQKSSIDKNQKEGAGGIEEWRKNRKNDMSRLAEIKAAKQNFVDEQLDVGNVGYNRGKIERLRDLEEQSRNSVRKIPSTTGLNGTDLSMCLVFYVLCTIIIIFGYFHFMVRKRMKPSCCLNDMV